MERTCKKTRKNLFAHLNLQLEDQTASDIEGHLARCPLCRKEAEGLQSTWNLLGIYSIDKDFPDLMPGILAKMEREERKAPKRLVSNSISDKIFAISFLLLQL